jgi:tetratricopeptide (TPR) repeat protein
LKNPAAGPLENVAMSTDELVPIFSRTATPRDLGLAYYNASFNGKPLLQRKSYALLKSHEVDLDGDAEALDALASMNAEQGDFIQAKRIFEKVLALDPTDFTAATNLGTLYAKSGDLKQAIAVWQPAFQRNQVIPGLAENLARAQCRLGAVTDARLTLQTILSYSPGLQRARDALVQLPKCDVPK